MIVSTPDPNDLEYLVSVLGIEQEVYWHRLVREPNLLASLEVEQFLHIAEDAAGRRIEEGLASPDLDFERLQRTIARFTFSRLEDVRYGIDYNAELRSTDLLVSEELFPALVQFVVSIPGDRGFSAEREDHGWGYHIHYVKTGAKRNIRTNVIFTFDPLESITARLSGPSLFWEHHHKSAHVSVDPSAFGPRRRIAIYDTCKSFLAKVAMSAFKRPSVGAAVLYP